MRRFERQRMDRRRRVLGIVGLSFGLGALTSMALMSGLSHIPGADIPPAVVTAGTPTAPVPPHDPGGPAPVGPRMEPLGPSTRLGAGGPRPTATTGTSPGYASAVDELRDRDLAMPVEGVDDDDLRDTFFDARNGRAHEALDIMAPRRTPVRSVEGGRVAKLFNSQAGGLTVYVFDPSERFAYYYAHLDRYAGNLTEGQVLERGDVLGFVGSTGNASADAPHLHFAIFRLTPEKQWWLGEPINPYLILK